MRVFFSATFLGGVGQLDIKIKKAGKEVTSLSWDKTAPENRWVDLPDGFYALSVTGVAPPGGVELKVFKPTTPVTPVTIAAGPITRAFTMKLKEQS